MHTIPNGMINDTVGDHSVIRAPMHAQCHLSLHLVWYAYFIFYSVHSYMYDYFMIHPTPQCPCMYIAIYVAIARPESIMPA